MENVLITGANRGIGLELARQFAENGQHVFATCRDKSSATALTGLAAAGNIAVLEVEVTDDASVAALRDELDGVRLDVLVNNAGVMGGKQSVDDMDYAAWADALAVNTMAPLRVFAALKPNLLKAERPRVVTVSSQMGALSGQSTGAYAYRSSKAAVNKVMTVLATEVAEEGIIVCPVHPGWVRTDMGGPNADLSVEQSAAGLLALINGLTAEQSGRFWNWDGSELDW